MADFRVRDSEGVVLGKAPTGPEAITIMAAYYVREPTGALTVTDVEDVLYASIGALPEEDMPNLTLSVHAEQEPGDVYQWSFAVSGIQESGVLDYADGSQETVNDGTLLHRYQAHGAYHVTLSEGQRQAEVWLTIPEPSQAEDTEGSP